MAPAVGVPLPVGSDVASGGPCPGRSVRWACRQRDTRLGLKAGSLTSRSQRLRGSA